MSVNKLKLKRSAVTGRYPTTASLDLGELAINTYDGKVFFKKDDGVQTIVQLADVSGSILSASYAQTASYSDNFTVAGTIRAQTLVVQVITSSTEYVSGSTRFGSLASNTHQFTGSVSIQGPLDVTNGITGSFSGSLNNLQGSATHIPYFSSSQVLQNSSMIQIGSESIAINQDGITTAAPEALYVWQPNTDSFNVISGKGNSNNYLQLNIQNTNQGVSASSDIVATANNGDETTNYIDMGINSQNFTGPIGDANDAYLYSTGQHLHIGNTTAGKHLGFFVGGDNHEIDRKFQLNPNDQHQMTGSLDVTSFVSASSFVTRGATAAQFVKGDGTLDSTNYLSSSVFYASSASLNAFSASVLAATASLNLATASLYAASASINLFSSSFNAFSASINAYTASQNVLNGTYATTGSNIFKGNQIISGSLSVSGSTNVYGTTNLTGSVNISGSTGTAITANVDTIVFTGTYNQSGSVSLSGSVDITGSLVVNGRNYINDSSSFSTRTLNLENTSASILLATQSLYAATASLYSATASLYTFSASINAYTASNNGTITQLYNETASLRNATASLYTATASLYAASASINAFTASINSYTSSNNAIVAQLYNETASLKNATSSIYLTTASLYEFSASINSYTSSNNDIIAQLYNETASLKNATSSLYLATASLYEFSASINSYTSSNNDVIAQLYATTASLKNATASLYLATQSLYSFSASMNSFTASQLVLNGTYATTGSNIFKGNQTIEGNLFMSGSNRLIYNNDAANSMLFGMFDGGNIYGPYYQLFGNSYSNIGQRGSAEFVYDVRNGGDSGFNIASFNGFTWARKFRVDDSGAQVTGSLIVTGDITAQRLVVQTISSSVIFSSGSNKFGDELSDVQQFTGSVEITGSLSVNGRDYITDSGSFSTRVLNLEETSASVLLATASLYSATQSLYNATASIYLTTASLYEFSASINAYTSSNNDIVAQLYNETASLKTATASLYSATASIYSFSASINSYTASNNAIIAQLYNETSSLKNATASLYNATASIYNATASLYAETASLKFASASINLFTASINAYTASMNAYTASNNGTIQALYAETASIQAATASLNLFSASFNEFSASVLTHTASVNTFSASINSFTSSINAYTASNNGTISQLFAETASLKASTASLYAASASINAFTASQLVLNGTYATTGSNVFKGNQTVTGSLFTSGSNTLVGSTTLTGSFSVSGSTIQTGNNTLIGNTVLSGSIIISGSVGAQADFSVGGTMRLDPAIDPGPNNITASYLFTSASNTATGYDLYYRQDGNLIKFKWIEGGLSTGLLYGGGISYSGSTIFVKPGTGIINNMNASTGSEINPIITYVNWGPYTASVQNLTSSQNTYLYVDASGSIFQQTSFFNQTQYEQAIPLGRVTHPNFISITGYGSNVQTTYDSDTQQNDFIRAFGPIKVSGFSINAHTGSLGLGIGDGIAYNLGGFYSQDPNSPSHYESNGFATASIARAWRSGSGVYLDNNGGAFYNAVDPDYWDDGTGTLNTMSAGDWQIQRVFANPVTGRVVVYYGQNVYTTLLNALQYLATDSFTEGEFTAKSLVFVGYLVLKGQTNNLTDNVNNRIINAGIFRNIAGGSAGGSAVVQRLENLADVVVTTPSNGQALIYDGGNWINSIPLSSSYALSASYSATATSSSYATTASSADNFLVRGTLTAQNIVVQTISSSVDYVSGSTKFGTLSSNTHEFTGSVSISGSLVVTDGVVNSLTSSYAVNADLLDGLDSTSFVSTGSFGAQTASFNAFSASINAYTASNNTTIQALYAETASIQAATASLYAASASINAYTASQNILNGTFANTASFNAFSASINNYTASNNGTISQLFAETASLQAATASLNLFSASINAYTASNNTTIQALYAETASIQLATASLYAASASINAFTASINSYTASNNGTIAQLYAETASILAHTASINAFSASINAYTSSNNDAITSIYSATASLNLATASLYAATASIYNTTQSLSASIGLLSSSFLAFSGSYNTGSFSGSLVGTASWATNAITASSADDFLVRGTLTAQTIVVQTITSSVNFVTGSTKFGTIDSNTHEFTGSVSVSGSSISLNGSNVILSNQTSSMSVLNAQTASYWSGSITNAVSASFAETASYWSGSIINAETASFVQIAQTASYWSGSIINAETASFVTLAQSASYWSGSIKNALNATFASTASYWSGSIINAVSAAFAELASSSSYALTASYAANAGSGGGGGLTALYILDEGIVQGTASYLDFNGAGVTATVYDGTASINIPGGGGGSSQSGGNAVLTQSVANVTWSFTHNLETQYPVFTIYDNNNDVIIPQRINAVNTSSALIYFSSARTGYAVASKGGDITSASYALVANSASFASTASFVRNAQTASYVVLSQTASYTPNAIVSAVLDIPLNDTIEFTLGDGTTSLVTINNVGTASYVQNAQTASFVQTAQTASFVTTAQTASFVQTAQTASFVTLAQTASFVQTAQTASYWSGSIQNAVSAAFADFASSASYSLTASYATFAANGGGGGISAISIADEGILQGSASYFDFTGAGVSVSVASNTASFTITGGGGTGTAGLTTTFTQSVAAVTWSFNHSLNTRFPLVQVYDTSFNQVQPQFISSSNASTVIIGFGVATAGYAVASMGGTLSVTGSNVVYNQSSAATTWSFAHNLNNQYPIFQVFDSNNEVIVPERIVAVSSTGSLIYFPVPVAGRAVASVGGMSGSGGSGAGFPFSGSAVITGSFLVSGSFADFTNVGSFTGNLTGSLLGTASYALNFPAYTVRFTQSVAATTWSFVHSMNTRNPIVQVYGSDFKQLIPNEIVGVDANTVEVRFDYAESGYAVLSNGGGLYVTGSTSTLVQSSPSVTWSFAHNLNSKYPNFEVYDSNDYVIIPANIRAIDNNNAELHFATAQAGRAIANFSGIEGAPNATSASYAASGSNFVVQSTIRLDQSLMDYASVNSSIVGSNNLFTQPTGSYTAAFFKYTAASGSNARAGEVSTVWNGGTVEFMDVSTNDIGNTNVVTSSISLVGADVQFNMQTNTSGWRIKSTATFI